MPTSTADDMIDGKPQTGAKPFALTVTFRIDAAAKTADAATASGIITNNKNVPGHGAFAHGFYGQCVTPVYEFTKLHLPNLSGLAGQATVWLSGYSCQYFCILINKKEADQVISTRPVSDSIPVRKRIKP